MVVTKLVTLGKGLNAYRLSAETAAPCTPASAISAPAISAAEVSRAFYERLQKESVKLAANLSGLPRLDKAIL